jgi:hypothetical protein
MPGVLRREGKARKEMEDNLEVKWPWEMVWMECVDDFIDRIKESLPSDHELQGHKLFPGIKWYGRPIFIVDDDTTGEYLLMDLERTKRWRKSKGKVPTIAVFKTREEVLALIERDHHTEVAKYRDESLKQSQNHALHRIADKSGSR